MKKPILLLFSIFLLAPVTAWGQVSDEDTLKIDDTFVGEMVESIPTTAFKNDRYIYLWDVTHSMQGIGFVLNSKTGKYQQVHDKDSDIYDLVVEEMIRDINSITDETAEIVVIPFQSAAAGSYRGDKDPWIYKTASGANKQELIQRIQASKKNWLKYSHEVTDVVPSLSYVINSVISDDREDYLKILTDGKMNDIEGLRKLMADWCAIARQKKSMHAFYISLNDEASEGIRAIISKAQEQEKDCFKLIKPGDITKVFEFYQVIPYPSIAVNANDMIAAEAPSVTAQLKVKGPGKLPESFKVKFESEENPFISVNAVSAVDNNSFNVPLSFKMDLNGMKRHFHNGMKYPVRVHLTTVDGDNVYLLDDIVTLYITVEKEKKMTLSWE